MGRLATHRNHERIDAFFFKIGVVNQWRLETVRWVANVGDQLCIAINVHHKYIKKRSLKKILKASQLNLTLFIQVKLKNRERLKLLTQLGQFSLQFSNGNDGLHLFTQNIHFSVRQ